MRALPHIRSANFVFDALWKDPHPALRATKCDLLRKRAPKLGKGDYN